MTDGRERRLLYTAGVFIFMIILLAGGVFASATRDGDCEQLLLEQAVALAMTSIATISGLLPILFGGGTGSQVMQRIAAPMVGGMVTTTLLWLLVIPVINGIYLQLSERFCNR